MLELDFGYSNTLTFAKPGFDPGAVVPQPGLDATGDGLPENQSEVSIEVT